MSLSKKVIDWLCTYPSSASLFAGKKLSTGIFKRSENPYNVGELVTLDENNIWCHCKNNEKAYAKVVAHNLVPDVNNLGINDTLVIELLPED